MIATYFDTSAFVPLSEVPRGIYGNAGRGLIYGPGDVTTDLAVLRHFGLGAGLRLQLRGEFFNAFNHVNFGNPNTTLSSSTFGRITGAGAGRVSPGRGQADLVKARRSPFLVLGSWFFVRSSFVRS